MTKVEIYKDHDGEWSELRIDGRRIIERHHFGIGIFDLSEELESLGIITLICYDSEDGELTKNGNDVDIEHVPDWVREHHETHLDNKRIEEEGY